MYLRMKFKFWCWCFRLSSSECEQWGTAAAAKTTIATMSAPLGVTRTAPGRHSHDLLEYTQIQKRECCPILTGDTAHGVLLGHSNPIRTHNISHSFGPQVHVIKKTILCFLYIMYTLIYIWYDDTSEDYYKWFNSRNLIMSEQYLWSKLDFG